jgi:hypothetical protein
VIHEAPGVDVFPPDLRRPNSWITYRFLLAYVSVFALVGTRMLAQPSFWRALIDTLILCVLCLFAWLLPDERGDRRALRLFSFFNFLFYGFVALLILALEAFPASLGSSRLQFIYQRVGGEPLEVLDHGILLAVIAQCTVLTVCAFARRRETRRRSWQSAVGFVDHPLILPTIVVAFVISNLAPNVVPIPIAEIVHTWGILLTGILALRLVRWMRGSSGVTTWLWIVALMAAVGLASGWRGRLIELVLLVVIVVVAERGRLPRRLVLFSALGLIMFLPWAVAYRSTLWYTDQGSGLEAVVNSAQVASRETASLSIKDRAVLTVQFLALRVGGQRIDELAGISAQPIRMHGSTIWPFLTSPIPRFFWPDKPALSPQLNKIAVVLKKSPSTDTTRTSMVWTQYTDLYLNFGVAGLVLGTLLLAIVLKWLNSSLLRDDARSPESVGTFVVLFTTFWGEQTIGMMFQFIVRMLLLFGLIGWLATTRGANRTVNNVS